MRPTSQSPLRAVIYTRISRDAEGRELGVSRQEEDCRALAERLGYVVVHVYVENDRGASTRSRKSRPLYAEMIERAGRREFDAILAYSNSRLTRRPRENEDLIELVEKHGVEIRTVTSGQFDLTTADGRAVVRTIAAWDAAEAERTGDRASRAQAQLAKDGYRNGQVPLGWTLDADGCQVLDPTAAPMLQEAATRLLGGEGLRTIAVDFNRRGFPTGHGNPWTGHQLRRVLQREANAGRRKYKGQVLAERAQWPPLYPDPATHDRVVALLRDPARKTTRGTAIKYLLSGIIRCGRPGCGAALRVHAGGSRGRKPAYVCMTCCKCRRVMEPVDTLVVDALVERLARPDAPNLFGGDPDAIREATEEVETLTARLGSAADDYAEGALNGEQLRRITARLTPKIDAARARAQAALPSPQFARFLAPGDPDRVREVWDEEARIEVKRALIEAVMTVRLLPSGPGVPFSPEQVEVTFRGRVDAAQTAA